METKCKNKRCRKVFSFEEKDITRSSRDYESYGEMITMNYKWVKCPHCGEIIYMGASGWSV